MRSIRILLIPGWIEQGYGSTVNDDAARAWLPPRHPAYTGRLPSSLGVSCNYSEKENSLFHVAFHI